MAPIISKKCSICHNPKGSAPINYVNYEDVAHRRTMFKYVIKNDLMPPWNVDPSTGPYKNDLSLTAKEKRMLLNWVDDGSSKKKWGRQEVLWKKRENRKAVDNSDESYTVQLPAKVEIPSLGFNEYKRFVIPINFKHDRWVKSVDFFVKPKVIHHMWLFIMKKSFPSNKDISKINLRDYMRTGFVTLGKPEEEQFFMNFIEGKDIGYKLPRNSTLVLEIHYESIGQKIIDDYTHVKITFYKNKPKYKTLTYVFKMKKIAIPSYESNYKIKMLYKVKKTRQLMQFTPHMHLRGKASSLYVVNPNGVRKKIFSIDPYLFSFQADYAFKQPLTIEKDSTLECVNWFDNSAFNPVNPDPSQLVKSGFFIKDEMSECYLEFLVSSDSKDISQMIVID